MFGLFTKPVSALLDIGDDLFSGRSPKKDDVVALADAGLTVAAIATGLDMAESAVEKMLNDED